MISEQKEKSSFIQKDTRSSIIFQNYQQQQNEIELKPKLFDKQELELIYKQLEQQIRMKNIKQNHQLQQVIGLIVNLNNVIYQIINSKPFQQQQKKEGFCESLCNKFSSKQQNNKTKLNQPLLGREGKFSVFNNLSDNQKQIHFETLLNGYIKTIELLVNLEESYSNLYNKQVENVQQLENQKIQKNEQLAQLNQKDQQINQLNSQIDQYQKKLQQQYQNVDEFQQELITFQSYHEALNEDYQQSQRKIQSLESQLKQLQDKNSTLVLNFQKTIEHNHQLINENNNLRSQILSLQIQLALEKDLKIESSQQSHKSDQQSSMKNIELVKNKENLNGDKQNSIPKEKLVSNHFETQSTEDENSQQTLNLITNGY